MIQATAVSLPPGIKADEVDIDKVKMEFSTRGYSGYTWYEIAKGDYDKGRFILNLPLIVEDKHLRPIVDGLSGGVQVSNVNAKFVSFETIGAYSTNRGSVGNLLYCKDNARMEFWYVDSDVNITGSLSKEVDGDIRNGKFNLSLKRGWNKVYLKAGKSSNEYASKKLSGLTWHLFLF
ncbi:hypothetical protein AGMMS4957_05170 [Bacteroidia bacterium]|nr:hypothetical protein AGMMS4957_05170 [Bacteroidia bacterium]